MRHLDLFSGIGGFALAARWVWGKAHRVLAFVEIDPFCQEVLRKHFPGVPIHDDIRTFKATHLVGRVDLLTGGWPCQPFSHAGKRRGKADDRYLWPEMRRIIEECRPRWVVGENVAGIINLALDDVLSDLEALGYEAWPIVVPACAVNAPHRRDRVWIVAYNVADSAGLECTPRAEEQGTLRGMPQNREKRHHACGSGEALLADAEGWRDGERSKPCGSEAGQSKGSPRSGSHAEKQNVADADLGGCEQPQEACGRQSFSGRGGLSLADAESARQLRSVQHENHGTDLQSGGRSYAFPKSTGGGQMGPLANPDRKGLEGRFEHDRPDELPSWAGGGLPMPWPVTEWIEGEEGEDREVERVFRGVADGVPLGLDGCGVECRPHRNRRPRLQALGNAIVPQVAAVIFEGIKKIETETAKGGLS
ncbi:DNA (cytosine-5-)-methyltransferase (plasmid) [Thermosulfurimonas sp. F29]|nr:DNA (cytosine-5-)-methyltransferase [Thermosulfurimonas sp. F29]